MQLVTLVVDAPGKVQGEGDTQEHLDANEHDLLGVDRVAEV